MLLDTIREIFNLCNLKKDEKVALITGEKFDEELIHTYMIALEGIDVDFLRIIVPNKSIGGKLVNPIEKNMYAIDVLKKADFVINIITGYPLRPLRWPFMLPIPSVISMYSKEFSDILSSGTRWMDNQVPLPHINYRRLLPNKTLIDRTRSHAKKLELAERIKITSESGTHLIMDKKNRKAWAEYGIPDTPGSYAIFGKGNVCTAPLEDSVNGTLVVDLNDFFLALGEEVTEPIYITFKNGIIRDVKGGATASLFRRFLAKWNDNEVYKIGHVGWGTHKEAAVWFEDSLFCTADHDSYPGVVTIHFGNNIYWQGANKAKYHISGVSLLNCNLYIDDNIICKKGKLVDE